METVLEAQHLDDGGMIFVRPPVVTVTGEPKITASFLSTNNRATDRGSLQKELHFPGTSPQVPCLLEEG